MRLTPASTAGPGSVSVSTNAWPPGRVQPSLPRPWVLEGTLSWHQCPGINPLLLSLKDTALRAREKEKSQVRALAGEREDAVTECRLRPCLARCSPVSSRGAGPAVGPRAFRPRGAPAAPVGPDTPAASGSWARGTVAPAESRPGSGPGCSRLLEVPELSPEACPPVAISPSEADTPTLSPHGLLRSPRSALPMT